MTRLGRLLPRNQVSGTFAKGDVNPHIIISDRDLFEEMTAKNETATEIPAVIFD